ncbi:MAG TPA: efflux RND transporter periplasmic adaptor subunit [Gemmatimonadales bacterium]|jgi:cobalt-zinc-cadmium efflux system membrane fusion protein|nr:efflux RND transporter periplasmic adaptor subunit [Gemmatimonadales bacterium]
MSTKRIRVCAGVLVLLIAGCAKSAAHADDHPGAFGLTENQRARIHLAPVAQVSFQPSVSVSGTVAFDGDHSTQVLAPISGPVSRILVEPGAQVAAGQPLAYVSSPDFAAALATYRKANATAINLNRIATRDSVLFANDALARQDLEQAQTDAASASADRDAALDQLRAIGVDSAGIAAIRDNKNATIPQGVIRAPLPGTVVERLITPGQLIQAGQTPCFTVAGLATMWVMGNVFEHDLPDVTVGDPADISPGAGTRVYHGRVDYVGALVDPNTRATSVRIVTSNPDLGLKKDMYVAVTIHSRRARTGLLVPVGAVLRDDQNLPFVFVAKADSSFERRSVGLGNRIGDRFEVTSGLSASDQIITEGGLFLQFAENQ